MPTLQYLEDGPDTTATTPIRSLGAAYVASPAPTSTVASPPSMDNSRSFPPLFASPRTPCRSCRGGGRGDVNVNVNVSTGQHSTAGASSSEAATQQRPSMEGTAAPLTQEAVRAAVRDAVSDIRPTMEGAAQPAVEYRPFAVPQDRIVKQVEYRPWAAVWDRVKRTFVDRDVAHPKDRVKVVPAPLVKGAMETPVPPKSRATT